MNDIRTLIEEGKFHYRNQNFRKAEEMLGKVIAQKKEFADVYNVLGLIAHEKGRYDDAIHHFEKALKINPNYTEALLNLSILYNDIGEIQKARTLVERSRKESRKNKAPMDPFIRSKLANKHSEVGDWYYGVGAFKNAIQEYEKALSLEDKYVDIRTKLAVCHRESGNIKQSIDELKKALKDSPRFVKAHIQLGVSYFSAGKKKDARKAWSEASRKFPQNKTLKMYLSFTT